MSQMIGTDDVSNNMATDVASTDDVSADVYADVAADVYFDP